MQTIVWTCDNCGATLPKYAMIWNGLSAEGALVGKLHNKWLQPLNRDIEICEKCASKIDNEFAQLQMQLIAEYAANMAKEKRK